SGDARFRQRIDYLVNEMAECQQRYGDGYIGALQPLELTTLRDSQGWTLAMILT
ncbi:MAG: hypothetical protein JO117_03885, partial [Verrucomicrobia bacterium]|nr:hypothetical protein [Verrucomicrobiota bacterium]